MERSVLAGLLAAIATAGCVTPATLDAEAQGIEVSEAVLRHMFHNYGGGNRRPVAFCVGVRERFPGPITDAPPELIARFGDMKPGVKPFSGCVSTIQVLDIASGRPAASFHVGPIDCPTSNRCTAVGAYASASLSGAASEYVLERRGTKWIVTSQELRAIS